MRYALSILFLTSAIAASAQINWLSWEEAAAKQAVEPRKIVVDVYTQWCGWCRQMDARTFSDPSVAEVINDNFYPVKLDAEAPGQLRFSNKTFTLEKGGPRATHALARELLGGRLGYPTVVFLDEESKVIQAVPGFHEAGEFLKITEYFGQDHYRRLSWDEFDAGPVTPGLPKPPTSLGLVPQ